jgi:diaminopimelate dehydrogenase
MEFSLNLESNPELTASVMLAYARAVYRLAARGESGARTVFDIAPALLSPISRGELYKNLL